MGHNRGLPYLLGGFMALAAGLISYISGAESHTIYIRMALSMVVFYVLGTVFMNTLKGISKEVALNEEKKILAAMEEERKQHEARSEQNQPGQKQPGHSQTGQNQTGTKINLAADDSNDDFSPMTVSRVITSKMKE